VRIWRLTFPQRDPGFATATVRDSYSVASKPCRACKHVEYTRSHPLTIEWDAGSECIGDFTWANVTIPLVTHTVFEALRARFTGFEGRPVKMVQDPRLRRPLRPTKRTAPRVWLPYAGPELSELWLTTWVHMDRERTTARLARRCKACANERYELIGAESFEHHVEVLHPSPGYRARDYYTRVPRRAGQGLYIRAADLGSSDFFRVHEFSGWTFCTERARSFIEEKHYTNVELWEMGDAVGVET
jgi:hypothetical protein